MSFTTISKPAVGDPTKKSLIDAVIDSLTYLFNSLLGLASQDAILNGSFEIDSDADGIPDGWTETTAGGTISLETTAANVAHGAKSLKFVSTGSGGGYITSTDYFECTDKRDLVFSWQMKSTVAGVLNKVEISFYDNAKSFISTTVLYTDSATNPTAYTLKRSFVTPPATSRYAKLKITGANSATAGSTWYDDFQVVPSPGTAPQGYVAYTSAGSSTFTQGITVPAYVSRIKVRAWGGGGAGNSVSSSNGGGGGGGYAEGVITLTAGQVVTVTIGAAGVSGGSGATGSTFGSLLTASAGAAGGVGAGGAGGAGGGSALGASWTGGTGTLGAGGGGASPMGGTSGISPGGGGQAQANGTIGRVIIEY